MCVCGHTCTHVRASIRSCFCLHVSTCVRVCVSANCALSYVCGCAFVHVCVRTYNRARMRECVCA